MGLTYAGIALVNAGDIEMARRFIIGRDEIKRSGVNLVVDRGSYNLGVNEKIQAQLDLPFAEKEKGN